MSVAALGRYLVPSILPTGDKVYFRKSSFFSDDSEVLPTPSEVILAAGDEYKSNHPPPVILTALKLIVKYGFAITVAEAKCL